MQSPWHGVVGGEWGTLVWGKGAVGKQRTPGIREGGGVQGIAEIGSGGRVAHGELVGGMERCKEPLVHAMNSADRSSGVCDPRPPFYQVSQSSCGAGQYHCHHFTDIQPKHTKVK